MPKKHGQCVLPYCCFSDCLYFFADFCSGDLVWSVLIFCSFVLFFSVLFCTVLLCLSCLFLLIWYLSLSCPSGLEEHFPVLTTLCLLLSLLLKLIVAVLVHVVAVKLTWCCCCCCCCCCCWRVHGTSGWISNAKRWVGGCGERSPEKFWARILAFRGPWGRRRGTSWPSEGALYLNVEYTKQRNLVASIPLEAMGALGGLSVLWIL